MYHVGQLVIGSVTHVDPPQKHAAGGSPHHHKVQLTLDPDVVNRGLRATGLRDGMALQCAILSHEDKGYLLASGLSSVKAFLPYHAAEEFSEKYLNGQKLSIGCSILTWVTSTEGGRVVKMGMEPGIFDHPTRDLLMPGMLLHAYSLPPPGSPHNEQTDHSPGLHVGFTKTPSDTTIGTRLVGFVPRRRLPTPAEPPGAYPEGTEVLTTVTYVKHNTTLLGLSGCTDLLDPSKMDRFLSKFEIGQILELTATHVTASEGVFFKVQGEEKGIVGSEENRGKSRKKKRRKSEQTPQAAYAYAPRERLQGENVQNTYEPGTVHTGRILGRSMLDRLLFASTKRDILNQKIVSVETAQVGTKIKATVTWVGEDVVFGTIYNHIKCVIERRHTADTPPAARRLDSRFKEGQKVTGRVLSIDSERNRLRLTLKPSLVNSELGIVDSYEKRHEGALADGMVVFVNEKGLVVQFYANVQGWLSKTDLRMMSGGGIMYGGDFRGTYNVGQVIRVRIVTVQPEAERMLLSINLTPEEMAAAPEKPVCNEPVKTGSQGFQLEQAFDVKILEKQKGSGFQVEIKSGKLVISGFLPTGHLADSAALSAVLEESYNVNDVIWNCTFFANGPQPTVTAKFSIIRALLSGKLPKSFEAVEEHRPVTGVIARKHADLGFFVDFPGNLSALLPFRHMEYYGAPDERNSGETKEKKTAKNANFLAQHPCFALNQSIDASTWRVDSGSRKFSLNAQRVKCLPRSLNESIDFLANNLMLLARVKIWAGKSPDSNLRALSELTLGSKVSVRVESQKSIIDTTESNAEVYAGTLIDNSHVQVVLIPNNDVISVGDVVEGALIDIDWTGRRIFVAPRLEKNATSGSNSSFELGISRKGRILHVTELYAIVALTNAKTLGKFDELAYIPSQLYQGDIRGMSELRWRCGKQPQIWVVPRKVLGNNVILANLEVNEKKIGWALSPNLESASGLEVTGKSKGLKSKLLKTHVHIAPGATYDAQISDVESDHVKLLIGGYHTGVVHGTEIDTAGPTPHFPTLHGYKVGQMVKVRVVSGRKVQKGEKRKFCECTMRKAKMLTKRRKRNEMLRLKDTFSTHERILAIVRCRTANFVDVSANSRWIGRIPNSNVEQALKQGGIIKEEELAPGSLIHVYVTEVLPQKRRLNLSLTPAPSNQTNVVVPHQSSALSLDTPCDATISDLKKRSGEKGEDLSEEKSIVKLSLRLPESRRGICHLTDVCDNYDKVSDVIEKLRDNPSRSVKCMPYALTADGTAVVTLRKSILSSGTGSGGRKVQDPWIRSGSDLKSGQVLRGFVVSSHMRWLFVRLGGTVVGKVPLSEVSEYFVKDPKTAFTPGQCVTVCVVRSEPTPHQATDAAGDGESSVSGQAPELSTAPWTVELSMLPEKTDISDQLPADQRLKPRKRDSKTRDRSRTVSGGGSEILEKADVEMKSQRSESDRRIGEMSSSDTSDQGGSASESEQDMEEDENSPSSSTPGMLTLPPEGQRLNLTANRYSALNLMNVALEMDKKETGNVEENGETKKPDKDKSKAQTKPKSARTPLANPLDAPSLEHFNDRIQSNPNDPDPWLDFMQHWQSAGEPEKARAIGRRALDAIDFRESTARFTIWKSLLRLELEVGTEDAVKQLFEEAARRNDELATHKEMAELYEEFGKKTEADALYESMLKKFRENRAVYEWAAAHWMSSGQLELARQTMQRGLKFLDKSEHIQLIVHSARLEFSVGDAERGKTLFEGLVNAYPKRNDLWSVYVDMLLKFCSLDLARSVFERVLLMRLSARQMKFFFAKWMDVETRHGDEASLAHVRQKALEAAEGLADP